VGVSFGWENEERGCAYMDAAMIQTFSNRGL
jgi:hypothetical protein